MPKATAKWFLSPKAKTEYVRVRLERWERLFAASQNPRFAWSAYSLTREAGLETPEWVLKYLDSVAANLPHLWNAKKGEIARRLVEAFGFVPGGTLFTMKRNLFPESDESTKEKSGAFNPFDSAEERQLRLSENVEMNMQAGMTFKEAKRETARTARPKRVSLRTVERALQLFPIRRDI